MRRDLLGERRWQWGIAAFGVAMFAALAWWQGGKDPVVWIVMLPLGVAFAFAQLWRNLYGRSAMARQLIDAHLPAALPGPATYDERIWNKNWSWTWRGNYSLHVQAFPDRIAMVVSYSGARGSRFDTHTIVALRDVVSYHVEDAPRRGPRWPGVRVQLRDGSTRFFYSERPQQLMNAIHAASHHAGASPASRVTLPGIVDARDLARIQR